MQQLVVILRQRNTQIEKYEKSVKALGLQISMPAPTETFDIDAVNKHLEALGLPLL